MRGAFYSSSRTILLHVTAVIVIGLFVSYVIVPFPDPPKFQSKEGFLDLTQVHISENPIKLKGEWAFYWNELLSPEDIHTLSTVDEYNERWINIPNSWLDYSLDGQQLNGTGFATFKLVIQLNEQDKNKRLALRLPSIFHSYKLWVNGEVLSEVGLVGKDKSSVTPHLATELVFFQPNTDRVELVMQVANFHHKRGGITKYIELGGIDVLVIQKNIKIASEMFITASLIVIGLYHLLLFVLQRKDKATLYFGLFTMLLGIRSMLVGELLITQLWPDFPWGLQFKIEYLILCSTGFIITMYSECIFPNSVNKRFHLGTQITTGILCSIVVLTPALFYTKLLLVIGVVVILHMIYLMIGLVQAAIRGIEGALLFLLVSVVALVTVMNDFLYYNEWSPIGNTSPFGILIFTIAQIFLLSSRFTRAALNEERIKLELRDANNKLTEMNTNLEFTVKERTRALSTAHDNLRTSYERLLHFEQGRKKLLAYFTHDLRMPLSNMLGYVEAVQDKIKPERNEQYLKYIRENTIKVNRMIEELSFLSHLETEQVPFNMEQVRVTYFLKDFYQQYELVVLDAGLNFILDFHDQEDYLANQLVVEMDIQRSDQALFNLVSNAMKFTSMGGLVRIALSREKVDNKNYAVISVEDSGIGIPQDQLEQIFNRNYRYKQPGVINEIEGSGLGLAICREIIQTQGGMVRAESDNKTGSIFSILLPCIVNERR